MNLQPGERDFVRVRDQLVTDFAAALASGRPDAQDVEEFPATVAMFLGYVYGIRHDLSDITDGEITGFLLDFVPAKYAGAPDDADGLCHAIAEFVLFMGGRGHLAGGVDRAARLYALAIGLADDTRTAMQDPNRYGLSKRILSVPIAGPDGDLLPDLMALLDDVDVDGDALDALVAQRMEAFNALPFDQRTSITDPSMSPEPARIQIPVVHLAPPIAEVEASAAASPLVSKVLALVDKVGASGLAVTQAGNLRLADAERLVVDLDTGDEWILRLPWGVEQRPTSSLDMRWLTLIADVAESAGAFIRLKTKIRADPSWVAMPVAERATSIIDAFFDVGPLSSAVNGGWMYEFAAFIEDGAPHWLSLALPTGAEIDLDLIVVAAFDGIQARFRRLPVMFGGSDEAVHRSIAAEIGRLFEVLEYAGLVEWHERETAPGPYGTVDTFGGWFRMTPLGQHTMPSHIRAAGYDFAELDDLDDADASLVVDVVASESLDVPTALARWRTGDTLHDRAVALASEAVNTDEPSRRLAAFALLGGLDPFDDVAPVVRQLLDSDVAGHAAVLLVERGQATSGELVGFIDVGPTVDALWMISDDPDELADMVLTLRPRFDGDLLEEIWRHDRPESLVVLESLGANTIDKALAKAARKAAMRHRSFHANRHR